MWSPLTRPVQREALDPAVSVIAALQWVTCGYRSTVVEGSLYVGRATHYRGFYVLRPWSDLLFRLRHTKCRSTLGNSQPVGPYNLQS